MAGSQKDNPSSTSPSPPPFRSPPPSHPAFLNNNNINNNNPNERNNEVACAAHSSSVFLSENMVDERLSEEESVSMQTPPLLSRLCTQPSSNDLGSGNRNNANINFGNNKDLKKKTDGEDGTGCTASSRAGALKSNNGDEFHLHIDMAQSDEIYKHTTTGDSGDGSKYVKLLKRIFFPSINRWAILVLYSVYCLICGPTYFNWSPLRQMLYWNGAYVRECDPSVTDKENLRYIDPETNVCDNQKIYVNRLYTICAACHFAFSMLGGMILDILGPKLTSMIGVTCQLIGWVLVGTSTYELQAYVPGFVFLGMGVDSAFFALLSGANLFPNNKSTVIAIWGATRSLSFVVPLALKEVMRGSGFSISFPSLCYGYVGVGLGLCYVIALFSVPMKAFVDEEEEKQKKELATLKHMNSNNNEEFNTNNSANENNEPANNALFGRSITRLTVFTKRSAAKLKDFYQYFCSPLYIPMIPYITFSLLRCIFYGTASEELLADVLPAFEIIATFSFLPCPLLGLLADKVGIMPTMQLCNFVGALMLVFVMVPNSVALQYLSSLCFAVMVSFLLSQVYCYAASTFPQEHMGKLIGILTAIGGLLTLLSDPMFQYSLKNGFYPMLGMLLGMTFLNALLLEYCRREKNKAKRRLNTQKTVATQSVDSENNLNSAHEEDALNGNEGIERNSNVNNDIEAN